MNDNCYIEYEKNKVNTEEFIHIDKETERLFNKMIILLKNTKRNMMSIIDDSEQNWLLYNTFIQHKNVIDTQIDDLLKEKKD